MTTLENNGRQVGTIGLILMLGLTLILVRHSSLGR